MGSSGLMRTLAVFALACSGCAFEAPPARPPTPSYDQFASEVYPVLLRDCGFPDCHGSPDRFFRVFGPGRTRMEELGLDVDDPRSETEVRASYERARSMLASARSAEDSLLVRKPLELDRGGAPHLGIDQHGQDVYRTTDAPGYRTLLEWARTGFSEAP